MGAVSTSVCGPTPVQADEAPPNVVLLLSDDQGIDDTGYLTDNLAREAVSFIERNRARPFFLYFSPTIPHANNEAGNKGMEVPSLGDYAELDWPEPQKGHAAMISLLDADIGRLLARLKELGLDEKTIVFFSSDNGPHKEGGADPKFFDSSGPLRGYKRSLHEGGIRVPMLVRWPDHVPAGTTSDLPCAFWDFLPTAAELVGVEPPAGLDGLSLVLTLLGKPGQRAPWSDDGFHHPSFQTPNSRKEIGIIDHYRCRCASRAQQRCFSFRKFHHAHRTLVQITRPSDGHAVGEGRVGTDHKRQSIVIVCGAEIHIAGQALVRGQRTDDQIYLSVPHSFIHARVADLHKPDGVGIAQPA